MFEDRLCVICEDKGKGNGREERRRGNMMEQIRWRE